jgi:hypothetical protein
MSSFFKGIALFVAICCGVWIAVLWRWQSTSRDMGTGDIVVYLVVLPLTVFGLALLLRWAWRGAVQRQSAAALAATTGAGAAGATPAAAMTSADDARRHATVQLLAAHLVCAAGASPAELQDAAKQGKPRPELDPELRDADGVAVFSARIADIQSAALAALLEPHLAPTRARQPEWAELAPAVHVQRALAALQEPLAKAVATLAPWAPRFEAQRNALPSAPPNAPPQRRVRVLLGWPADWSAFEQELGRTFVQALIAQGAGPIAPACYALTAHTGGGEELLLHADRLLQTLEREGHDEPVIVAACHSAIGEAAIEALERDAVLFSSRHRPKGRMPGEAAAALVLAPAAWPPDPEADAPVQHLHRPAALRRDKSVEATGRVGSDIARQALTQALAAGQLAADAVAALVCDADQHSERGAEFYGAGLVLLPHLDSGEDMRLIGTVTGAVGAVSALLVTACAAERAKAGDKPCLAMMLGDPFTRLALLALPGPPVVAARDAA